MAPGPLTGPDALADAAALWVVHHDYSGIGRVRVIPPVRFAEVLADGVTFGYVAWDYTIAGTLVPDASYSLASGDYRSVPDAASFVRLPHAPGIVQAFSDLHDDAGPWEGDPRGRLRTAWRGLEALGYRVRVALESEFQVVRDAPEEDWPPVERLPMYSVNAVESQWSGWMGGMLDALHAAGVPVHQIAREGAVGQYECSILPSDPVTACDRFLVARQVVKGAMPPGLVATFMPKPYGDRAGNGLHVHVSVVDADGRDVVADPADPRELSPEGRRIVSALVAHAPGQLALAAPTPNSFRRLVPGWGAPTHASWSMGNRSALVRIPGPGSSRRIEYRSGDQSCNPYLHVLGILATIRAALAGEVAPVAPLDVDLSLLDGPALDRTGALPLPASLPDAVAALRTDPVLLAALGPVIAEHYAGSKLEEHDAFIRATGGGAEVTTWERSTYLRAL